MAKSRPPREKHQPLRTCLGCGRKRPKKELVRVVRTPSGTVELDVTGKKSGRGAYLCPNADCLKGAVKGGKLGRALEVPVPPAVEESLAEVSADRGAVSDAQDGSDG